MGRVTAILFFLLASITGVFAQQIAVSDEIVIYPDYEYDLLGQLDDRVIVAKLKPKDISFISLDTDLSIVSTKEVAFSEKRAKILTVFKRQNEVDVYYTFRDKDSIRLCSRTYNSAIELLQKDTIQSFKERPLGLKFVMKTSNDENKMVFRVQYLNKIYRMLSYDRAQHKLLSDINLDVERLRLDEQYRKTIITNSGQIFLAFQDEQRFLGNNKNQFRLYQIKPGISEVEKINISLQDTVYSETEFFYNEMSKHFYIVGFYSDRFDAAPQGIFSMQLKDVNQGEIGHSIFPFNEEFLSSFYQDNRKRSDHIEATKVVEGFPLSDGGFLLFAEKTRRTNRIRNYHSRVGGRSNYTPPIEYNFDEIIVFSVDAKGAPSWQVILPKKQFSSDDFGRYSSFFIFENTNHLRLLYNDEIKNENTVSEYVLLPSGTHIRNNVLSTDNLNMKLQIRFAVQQDARTIYIPSVKGNELKVLKIIYE